jgi:hypothetical protein
MTGEYNNCAFAPASASNYRSGRLRAIDRIIIHVTESDSAEGAISWFANAQAQVSAHYVVDVDGTITQCVREADTAWAAPTFNARGLHIEHQGWTNKTAFPDAQLRPSANLCRHLADKYGIPADRIHILGHSELPNNDHQDPGHTWPWARYMAMVGGAQEGSDRFWNHPNGITVGAAANFSMLWPQGAEHTTIVANGKYPVWDGPADAVIKLSFITPGPHSLEAIATDSAGHSLGCSTLDIVVTP